MGLSGVSSSQSELSFASSPSGKLLRGHGPLAGAAAGGDGLQSHSRGPALRLRGRGDLDQHRQRRAQLLPVRPGTPQPTAAQDLSRLGSLSEAWSPALGTGQEG